MSRSYKVAVVLAVVLFGGIFAYHFLQTDGRGPTDTAVPVAPPDTGQAQVTPSADPPPPGIGDLMSRIRSHVQHANQTPPNAGQSSAAASDQMPPVTATDPPAPTGNSDPVATVELEPEVPTLTFGQHLPPANPSPTPSVANPAIDGATTVSSLSVDTPPKSSVSPISPGSDQAHRVPKTYTIQPGDTFSTIAVKIYGSEKHWIDVATANPFVDPKRLQVGQSIRLPSPDDVLDIDLKSATGSPGHKVIHLVRPGDSLSTIAQRYYHNADQWVIIFDANRDKIGHDPDHLRVGEQLRIPSEHMPAR